VFVRVRAPENEQELEKLWRFRYETYMRDRRKGSYTLDHDRRWIKDALDDSAHHLIAVDREGGVVGCLRTSFGHETTFPDYLNEWMRYPRLGETLAPSAFTYSSQLMVEPSLRGRTIASLLALAQFRDGIRTEAVVDTCCCELNLVHVYYGLGYRPYAPAFRIAGTGMRVPLVLCARDRAYLEHVESPLRQFVGESVDDLGETARTIARAFPDFVDPEFLPPGKKTTWAILAAGPGAEPEDPTATLFEGLDQTALTDVIGSHGHLRFQPGDQIYAKGEVERSAGLLLKGRIGVHMVPGEDAHYIAVLGPGDVYGEMLGLGISGRSAHLTVLEEAEVMLLPPDLVEKVGRKSPEMGFAVAKNLCRVLAHRLATADEVIARHMPVKGDAGTADSYHRKASDKAELARLDRQASVMVDQEVALLKSLGLADGQKVLDVGCGAGGLAIAMAKHLPGADVLGVDPNPVMTARAEEALAKAGVDNCRFKVGNGLALPLLDEGRDFVVSRLVLQHLSAPGEAVSEMRRVLQPGGRVVLVDIDDGGVVVHPEPKGYARMMETVQAIKIDMGANRQVGRELPALLLRAGFDNPGLKVLPVSSKEVPTAALLSLAFDFRERLLREAGAWDDGIEACFAGLRALADNPEALIFVPVFIAHARK
jgi:ubiquinone/menaquinone biosynthesis C-methylase UbiE